MGFDKDAELAFVPLDSEEDRAALRRSLPIAQKLFMSILADAIAENPLLKGVEAFAIIAGVKIATRDDMQ